MDMFLRGVGTGIGQGFSFFGILVFACWTLLIFTKRTQPKGIEERFNKDIEVVQCLYVGSDQYGNNVFLRRTPYPRSKGEIAVYDLTYVNPNQPNEVK